MSNQGLAQACEQRSINFIRSAVGDREVASKLAEHDVALGAEPSGHVIMRDILATGDGILAGLYAISQLAQSGNSTFQTFTHFPQYAVSIPVQQKISLNHPHIQTLLHTQQSQLSAGRIITRYSGTEPVLRIMVEAPART